VAVEIQRSQRAAPSRTARGDSESFAIFGAFLGAMVIAILLGAAPHQVPVNAADVVVSVFVLVWSRYMPLRGAVAAVVCAALFGDGFVIDRLGVLAWHGTVDIERLAGLLAAALIGIGIRATVAFLARPEPEPISAPVVLRPRMPHFAGRPHRSTRL